MHCTFTRKRTSSSFFSGQCRVLGGDVLDLQWGRDLPPDPLARRLPLWIHPAQETLALGLEAALRPRRPPLGSHLCRRVHLRNVQVD